ncbi:hypothetical protein L1887_59687 [Cichorium endivia]|nr:hypothetical protein L1887_59687 [Cichorium endivia]
MNLAAMDAGEPVSGSFLPTSPTSAAAYAAAQTRFSLGASRAGSMMSPSTSSQDASGSMEPPPSSDGGKVKRAATCVVFGGGAKGARGGCRGCEQEPPTRTVAIGGGHAEPGAFGRRDPASHGLVHELDDVGLVGGKHRTRGDVVGGGGRLGHLDGGGHRHRAPLVLRAAADRRGLAAADVDHGQQHCASDHGACACAAHHADSDHHQRRGALSR